MQARYPHLNGRTGLCYSDCGKYLFTCGDNGMIRRFPVGSPHIEPETIEIVHNGLDIAIVPAKPSGNAQFVVCSDDGEAEIFDVESLEKRGTLLRTALPLRELSVSGDGNWCLATGDDKCLAVNVNEITETKQVSQLPTKHALFHPTNSEIASVSTLDGNVRILHLSTSGEPRTIAELEMIVPAVKEAEDSRSTAGKWSPQGEALALPSKTFEVDVISTNDWLVNFRLKGHTNAITALEWSPNGRYLASCAKDNRLIVFDTSSGGSVADHELVDGCELKWHPHSNELSATTWKGQLYTFDEVVPTNLLPPFGGDLFNPVQLREAQAPQVDVLGEGDPLFLSSDDLEVVDDPKHSYDDRGYSDRHSYDRHNGGSSRSRPSSSKRMKLSAETPAQRGFQSGSTPWLDQKRYLCMSPTGYVWVVRQSSNHHTITISFFDQSSRREVHFQDNELFDLASLTPQAVLLANSKDGEVHVRFHSMLADNWSARIDTKVDGPIQCVAISTQVVAIFTKHGFMRVFTLYGSALAVSRTPPNVVSCAANDNEVLYVCHNQQNNTYTYTFENLAADLVYQKSDTLDITPNTQVKALFFSEEGEPCVMDSNGTLTTLLNSRKFGHAKWVPVLGSPSARSTNEEESVDEVQRKYWPIGVSENKLLCVVLRGQRQYPPIPLPITDEVKLAVPGIGENEGDYLVAKTLFQQAQSRLEFLGEQGVEVQDESKEELADQAIELDKMLLRQFQQACQAQRVNRALQLVQLIQGNESLQAAAQVAAAYEMMTLAERINEAIE